MYVKQFYIYLLIINKGFIAHNRGPNHLKEKKRSYHDAT